MGRMGLSSAELIRMDGAVLRCMEICAEEGWLPNADQTLKLIRLRAEYRAGKRSERLGDAREEGLGPLPG